MSENAETNDDLRDQFRQLGDNLKDAVRAAWESDERRKLQEDLEGGLRELGESFNEITKEIAESASGQQIKSDLDDFTERIHSGELERKIRHDLTTALNTANEELAKMTDKWNKEEKGSEESGEGYVSNSKEGSDES